MTQLYVGNLSAEADDKVVRAIFGKYGTVRETILKNGYAFVEYENPSHAEAATKDLNSAEILGSHIIVEPSHQQRITRRKILSTRVEVLDIPMCLTWEAVETQLASVGNIVKSEHDIDDYGNLIGYVVYEAIEAAQQAEATFKGEESPFKVMMWDEKRPASAGAIRGKRSSLSMSGSGSPNKQNDFPLRILVPGEMIGAIIGKDGATIRMLTQSTKARVDVHRKDGGAGTSPTNQMLLTEKTVTINGNPECCTEACHAIMKIMQQELLTQSNYTGPLDRSPSVPLKILAHNDLIGRVIGKGGNTLKRIMQESGTKITISKLKDLTPQKPERTITIMGTVDNCKKAESLISAKLRASFENDMAHLIPQQQQALSRYSYSESNSPLFSGLSLSSDSVDHYYPQSNPTSPVATETFPEFPAAGYSQVSTSSSMTTLELNGLSGFSHSSNPKDNTLLATQLASNRSSPPKGSNIMTISLDEDPEDLPSLSTGFNKMGLKGGPRRGSAPNVIYTNGAVPSWPPSRNNSDLLSPLTSPESDVPQTFDQFLEEKQQRSSYPPHNPHQPHPKEAWTAVPTSSNTPIKMGNPHHHQTQPQIQPSQEDALVNNLYSPVQSPTFCESYFFPSAYQRPMSAQPHTQVHRSQYQPMDVGFNPTGYPGIVMTSKLTGSPIKVKPEEDDVFMPPNYAWGSPHANPVKSNLFNFEHFPSSTFNPDITKVSM